MAEKKSQAKPSTPDSRDSLLSAARKVFARKGFEGATVKDLADEAGVNISLVSYHFGGKEGLYRACLEGFGVERIEATERVLNVAKSREDFQLRLKLFAEDFIAIHQRDPETCKMIHRGLEQLDPISADVFKSVFYRIFVALESFVESARRSGILRSHIDTEITTILMFGSLMHTIRSQEVARLLGKRTLEEAPYREQFVNHWVENFTLGIFADAQPS
jgi:TetR/AcrR family transcriptional regulator